jgi:hypothetical protein
MQPDRTSAVMAAMIGNRNARATRTGAIPSSETASVLHPLWLTNGFFAGRCPKRICKGRCERPATAFHTVHMMQSNQAAVTPAPIGHDTPVPPSPQ